MRNLRYTVEGEACYFLRTELSDGLAGWDGTARRVLFQQLFKVADFCGVKVVEAVVLPRELLVLVVVDPSEKRFLPDEERVRRYRAFYGENAGLLGYDAATFARALAEGGRRAELIRTRLDRNFHDLSAFMKLLKQRFARWYNAYHQRRGTIWRDRFESVLVQEKVAVLAYYRAFIRTAPLRAEEAESVEDYRWSTAWEKARSEAPGPVQQAVVERLEDFVDFVLTVLAIPQERKGPFYAWIPETDRPRWPDLLQRGGVVGEASFVEYHTRRWRGSGGAVPLRDLRSDAALHAAHPTRRLRFTR